MFQVAELVTSEFFEQGDRERSELKLTPSVSSSFIMMHLPFGMTFSKVTPNHNLKVGRTESWI